jgi:ABC-type phosphate/phosphonate transport system permease subunit
VRGLWDFLRANPQVLILLIICVVLGLGTFLAVVFGIASSGSTVTNGYSSDAIFAFHALLSLAGR